MLFLALFGFSFMHIVCFIFPKLYWSMVTSILHENELHKYNFQNDDTVC